MSVPVEKLKELDMPEFTVPAELLVGGAVDPAKLVRLCGFANTNSEVRRLVDQGGVKLDDATVTDISRPVPVADGAVLRVGKHRFARLRLPAMLPS